MPPIKIKMSGGLVAKKEVVRKLFSNRSEFCRTAANLKGEYAEMYAAHKKRHKVPVALVKKLASELGFDESDLVFVKIG